MFLYLFLYTICVILLTILTILAIRTLSTKDEYFAVGNTGAICDPTGACIGVSRYTSLPPSPFIDDTDDTYDIYQRN